CPVMANDAISDPSACPFTAREAIVKLFVLSIPVRLICLGGCLYHQLHTLRKKGTVLSLGRYPK
ncbi:hypothetical protein M9458_007395, partial [Cirrhinus mrigala]